MRERPVYFTILVGAKKLIHTGLHLGFLSIWISLIILCLRKTVSETSTLLEIKWAVRKLLSAPMGQKRPNFQNIFLVYYDVQCPESKQQ
jgi:hypothetical protein